VANRIRPVETETPPEFRIIHNITGDPLANLPTLPTDSPEFTPGARYTEERARKLRINQSGFMWPEEFFTLPHTFGWSPRTPAGLHADSARISYIDVPFKIFQNMLVNSGRSPSRLQMESTYYVYPTWINPRKKVHPDSIRTPPRIRNMVGLQHKSN
jgi:hypothetical protein